MTRRLPPILRQHGLASLLALSSFAAAAADAAISTPAGKLGAAIVQHVNTDTADQIRRWAPSILSTAFDDADQADFIRSLASTARDSGGLDIVNARADERQPGLVFLRVTGHRTGQQAMLVLTADDAQPGKLKSADLVALEDPALYADWPKTIASLKDLPQVIEPVLRQLVQRSDFSGCVSVSDGSKTVYDTCRGLADRNQGTANDHQTKFRIGSMNKMFTAVAIAQLVEAGKLKWDATVADLLPEYPDRAAAAKMTVWQLLHHTAGLGDFFVAEFFAHRARFVDPADYIELIARQPRASEPGAGWSYSNAGYVVLGRIVEKVSGEGYFDYIRRHVFAPSGMDSSGFDSLEDVTLKLAVGYFREGPFASDWKANWMTLPFKGSPAGGGFSTNADLLRFAAALQTGRLVNAQTLARMFDDEVPAGPGGYAAGFGDRLSHGRHIRGHAGGAPGMSADLAIVWEAKTAVAVTSNEGDSRAALMLAEHIADLLAASMAPAPQPEAARTK